MASSFSSTASVASSFLPVSSNRHYRSRSKISFRLSDKGLQPNCSRLSVVRAQQNDVNFSYKWFPLEYIGSFINKLLDPSVDNVTPSPTKPKQELLLETETEDVKLSVDPSSSRVLASEEPVSDEFISQVSNLAKLVDSKDIMELQLKHLDFELLIRKKEVPIPIQTSSALISIMQPSYYQPPPLTANPVPVPAAPESSLPPLKSPMAGTFYRSPAPGEPPFVKVGDKIQKGQVLCIIEAMKLMNEIEADQSGTIAEIVAEDGKPVSFDTPLFVIEP